MLLQRLWRLWSSTMVLTMSCCANTVFERRMSVHQTIMLHFFFSQNPRIYPCEENYSFWSVFRLLYRKWKIPCPALQCGASLGRVFANFFSRDRTTITKWEIKSNAGTKFLSENCVFATDRIFTRKELIPIEICLENCLIWTCHRRSRRLTTVPQPRWTSNPWPAYIKDY